LIDEGSTEPRHSADLLESKDLHGGGWCQ
jgi:hypothetical protein